MVWEEDADFYGALCGTGRIIQTNRAWGIHLGTKLGKGSELRLGYSQIINPAYIVRKGNMSFTFAFRLAGRNFLANLIKSIRPESYVDRRAGLRGNLIGLLHLITGRLTPEVRFTAELTNALLDRDSISQPSSLLLTPSYLPSHKAPKSRRLAARRVKGHQNGSPCRWDF